VDFETQELGKEGKNAELLALQASQHFQLAKRLLILFGSAPPVEVQGGLVHTRGTRKK
jgi:hypothetical protein